MNATESQTCFIIAPIGAEGTPERDRSDKILKHVISPVVIAAGFTPIRADQIAEPGIITSQVIEHLVDAPLVVAGLTGRNPNVFYELAIRHAVRKPVVQIIRLGESIPFDVSVSRTIQVDHQDLDSVENCKRALGAQIAAVQADPGLVDSPITTALDLQNLKASGDAVEKGIARVLSELESLRSALEPVIRKALPAPLISQDQLKSFVDSNILWSSLTNSAPFADAIAEMRRKMAERAALESAIAGQNTDKRTDSASPK